MAESRSREGPNRPKFSVVIVNWNGRRLLGPCLESLEQQEWRSFETIVVDNGSVDGSVEFIRERYPTCRVIGLPENRGFCSGNNEGIRHAKGEWIVLLNNDTEVIPEFLAALDEASRLFANAGMLACKMLFAESRSTIDNCGFTLSRAGTAEEIGRNEADTGQYRLGLEPFGPSGGAAAYKREVFDKVGLFDESFFLIYEDVDLAMRARLQGFKCFFVPHAVVFHKYRATLSTLPEWQVYYGQKNIERVYLKNMSTGAILRYGLLHVLYNVGAFFYFSRKHLLRPFLSAKLEVIRSLPVILRQRKEIQGARSICDRELNMCLTGGYISIRRLKKFFGLTQIPARQRYGR